MRSELLCISVLRVASGPRVKWASCKSALNPLVVYCTGRSKAAVPCYSYSLLLCGLFYEAICFMSYLMLFFSCVFMPPTSKKLGGGGGGAGGGGGGGHIASGLFVRPSIRQVFFMHSITLKPWMLLLWNFFYGFLMKKQLTRIFFLDRIMPLFWVMALWKNMDAILSAKYLKNY